MNANSVTLSTTAPLLAACASVSTKAQDVLLLVACLRAAGDTASHLTEKLAELREAASHLLQRLAAGNGLLADSAVPAMRSTLGACDDVILGVGHYVRLCVADPSQSTWSEHTARSYSQMVGTQLQILAVWLGVLELGSTDGQDARLRTADMLELRNQGLMDAQVMREIVTAPQQRPIPFSADSYHTEKEVVSGPRHIQRISDASSTSIKSGKTSTSTATDHPRSPAQRMLGAFRVGRGAAAADPKLLISELCKACREGKLLWAKSLLADGADVNGLDERCSPPLYYAVLHGGLELVKLLVSHGAHVGGPDGQSSAMALYAVLRGDIPILTYLLSETAPITNPCWDPRDRQRNRRITPLTLAIETGNLPAARLLLSAGADVHGPPTPTGLTPLCTAADLNHPSVVQLLLDHGARIDAHTSTTPWGTSLTALHIASYRGHTAILSLLLSAGADPTLPCTRGTTTGTTALHLSGSSPVVATLLAAGANIHAGDSTLQYPLSGAVQSRSPSAVRALVQHGAPVNAQDRRRETALHITCRLFSLDARSSTTQHFATHREIASILLETSHARVKAGAARIIRTECGKLLAKAGREKTPVDGRLGVLELMDVVGGVVEEKVVAEEGRVQSGSRWMIKEIIEDSVLAHIGRLRSS